MDGTVPPVDDSLDNDFLASSQSPHPSDIEYKNSLKKWFTPLSTFATTIALTSRNHTYDYANNPIPFMIDLAFDEYHSNAQVPSGQERARDYVIKDILGRPWPSKPIVVRERFSDSFGSSMNMPTPDGYWYWDAPVRPNYPNNHRLFQDSNNLWDTMEDLIAEGTLFSGEVNFRQSFYASDFNPPSWLIMPSNWSLPGVASGSELKVPLWIKDSLNKCKPFFVAAQNVRLTATYTGIENDMGPGTGCAQPH